MHIHVHTHSCGNQMFSLTPSGSLRWQSEKFGNSSLGSVTPPSIHPDGHTYFIHQNGTVVYRLMTRDGSLDKTYSVPKLEYFEPPILVGSMFMYLIGFEGSAVSIVPIELWEQFLLVCLSQALPDYFWSFITLVVNRNPFTNSTLKYNIFRHPCNNASKLYLWITDFLLSVMSVPIKIRYN